MVGPVEGISALTGAIESRMPVHHRLFSVTDFIAGGPALHVAGSKGEQMPFNSRRASKMES
jgi:hypothetical protein